ncbi:hypothetical protein HPB47_002624 [Ixodes persulcatus]|uniref:Uncharacterized protein n=1 Tax=Ixodes persulcatus TaxID=34615 RepID=A0AC60PKV0_IXOPE|nr:hypothetical protein HPB47_002624 [Ixodes persulcatus]
MHRAVMPTATVTPLKPETGAQELCSKKKLDRNVQALCCQHQEEARELREAKQRLEEDNERLTEQLQSSKERLKKAEELLDCCDMAKDLRRGLKRLRAIECSQSPAKVSHATLVDIGNNVLVNEAALLRAREKYKAAGPFARALLGLVFSDEELAGRSLTGRKSNAYKDAAAKEALDPVRLNAIIAHTIREYGDVEKRVKASLSSFLSRGH